MDVGLDAVGTLPDVHRAQLAALAGPWFNREVDSAEEMFVLLGELYGEPAADLGLTFARIADEDDPELILYDYWSDPGTGTGNYFFAGTVEETGGYEVQHYHEGVPLEETLDEARARALTSRSAL
jgi:hypothetical protein